MRSSNSCCSLVDKLLIVSLRMLSQETLERPLEPTIVGDLIDLIFSFSNGVTKKYVGTFGVKY